MNLIISTTTDSKEVANRIIDDILNQNYSPCVQLRKNTTSYFKWKDKIDSSNEFRVEIKTNEKNIENIAKLIKLHHNYEIPEIIMTEFKILNNEYKDWFNNNIRR